MSGLDTMPVFKSSRYRSVSGCHIVKLPCSDLQKRIYLPSGEILGRETLLTESETVSTVSTVPKLRLSSSKAIRRRSYLIRTLPDVMVNGSNVTVRGVQSTGNTSALFVVNGTVVRSISGIDPAMVKSIEVLKGPSASVYGMEGANGVIVIQLK